MVIFGILYDSMVILSGFYMILWWFFRDSIWFYGDSFGILYDSMVILSGFYMILWWFFRDSIWFYGDSFGILYDSMVILSGFYMILWWFFRDSIWFYGDSFGILYDSMVILSGFYMILWWFFRDSIWFYGDSFGILYSIWIYGDSFGILYDSMVILSGFYMILWWFFRDSIGRCGQRWAIYLLFFRGFPHWEIMVELWGHIRSRYAIETGETGIPMVSKWVCLKMSCTPFYPMVLLIIIPIFYGYFIGNIPNIFRQTHMLDVMAWNSWGIRAFYGDQMRTMFQKWVSHGLRNRGFSLFPWQVWWEHHGDLWRWSGYGSTILKSLGHESGTVLQGGGATLANLV